MARLMDLVTKFEYVYQWGKRTFRVNINPETGFNRLLNAAKREEAESAYNAIADFYDKLPRISGSVVPVQSFAEMEKHIAKSPVKKAIPNEEAIRCLKINCLTYMDKIAGSFGM